MNSRNTTQKKIILDTLSSLRTHPTINELHEKVKECDSSIGIATVYRNIKKFVNDGIVFVVKTQNGMDRYDFYSNHAHFECLNCEKIIDLYNDNLIDSIHEITNDNNLKFINCNLTITGYCNECKN